MSASDGKSPADFLKAIKGKTVLVKLNSGVDYRGVLACLDGYMNIAMEQTEEYVNGQLKNKYGDAFIRGNNGACVTREIRLETCARDSSSSSSSPKDSSAETKD